MSRVFDALQQFEPAGKRESQEYADPASVTPGDWTGPAEASRSSHRIAHAGEPIAATSPAAKGSFIEALAPRLNERLITSEAVSPLAVEQYRRLAAILHHTQEDRGIRQILVASALAGEGKTLTSTNLALTLSASYGRRVLLIDADLRRPGVGPLLGLPSGGGLGEALYSVQRKLPIVTLSDKLAILPAGAATSDPMAGLTSARMSAILKESAEVYEWVIIDSPPVGLLPDAKLLAAMADGALLVVRAGVTPFTAIQRALDALGRERLLGVVLNQVDDARAAPDVTAYYEYYGYSEPQPAKRGLFRRLSRRA